ncbi:MAG TPA: hypothetical protein VFW85_09900 [Gaiellaceae bacterium]|nr:hypothetical protein [Gaiellaceae bacterium]
MEARSQVELPSDVGEPVEVYVNGVPQRAGVDYQRRGHSLVFGRELAGEGRLGFWRWTSIIFGVAGTYRKNDKVDVVFTRNGRRTVVTLEPDRGDGV